MCFAQGHNALNAVVLVRLKLESLGLESSTLALSHFRFFITTVHLHMVDVLPYVLNKKKKAFTECSSANMHVHVCLYHSCHRIWKTEGQDPSWWKLWILSPLHTSFMLIFFNSIFVNYSPQYDDVQNPWFNFTQNPWLNYADSYRIYGDDDQI